MMRTLAAMALSTIALCLPSSTLSQEPKGHATVSIDSISANDLIVGTVEGIGASDHGRYKVVVYVLTDRWYVHPFADGGDGKAWASISPDGRWRLRTVKREFPSKKVAAVVVPRAYDAPPRLESLAPLPTTALTVKVLRSGEDDYGKL